MNSSLRSSVISLMLMITSLAFAQMPSIPPEFYDGRRAVEGDLLKVCIWEHNVLADFDKSVAQTVADTLLLELELVGLAPSVEIVDDGEIWDYVFYALADACQVLLGFELAPEVPLPDWLIPIRPYIQAPFELAVLESSSYSNLGELTGGTFIGSLIETRSDIHLMAFLRDTPNVDLRRLPFDSVDMIVDFLLNGHIDGALVWGPSVKSRLGEGLRLVPTAPMPTVFRQIGGILMESDSFLQQQIDQAIEAMIQDGTLDDIISMHDIDGAVP